MCGIFAIINADESLMNNVETINKIIYENNKRGPETKSEYYDKESRVYMAFHRLAINGIDDNSNQPLFHEDCFLIGNGEIFNFKELQEKYNLIFKTNSDMEVILHLYKKFGLDFINELNGEFAFVLHDKGLGETYIFRDQFGIRPLYHYSNGNSHVVSSTLKSVIMTKNLLLENSSINVESSISQFKPSSVMSLIYDSESNESKINYYKEYFAIDDVPRTLDKIQHNKLYELLYASVERRVLSSERPIGALLSGGLDSSLVCAIAQDVCMKNNLPKLTTFSIGMHESEDLKYAKLVADHIGSNHHHISMTHDNFFASIPQVIQDIESFDTTTVRASVGNWLIGKYIKDNTDIKVILNGDGSDELMGGYLYFKKSPTAEEFGIECKRLLKNINFFDVLRSDRSISSHGIEARTPFLDKDFVYHYCQYLESAIFTQETEKLNIRTAVQMHAPHLLPKEVLWRQKEAFSDGVSSLKKSWFQIIQENIENLVNKNIDLQHKISETKYPKHVNCDTLEKKYYYVMFETHFKGCSNVIPYYWMPRFIQATDSSARTLEIY